MTAPAAIAAEPSPAAEPAAQDHAWAERQLAVLGRLAEAGLEIAIALETQAKGGEAVVEGDLAMAYSRVARAVRQTIMLQSRLIEARQDRDSVRAGRRAAARKSASRLVRDVIDDEAAGDAERAERLAREAAERLEREDFGDLLSRPLAEAVTEICRDLGLSPDWLSLAEDCHAAEARLHAKPGSTADEEDEPYRGPIQVRWLDSNDSS